MWVYLVVLKFNIAVKDRGISTPIENLLILANIKSINFEVRYWPKLFIFIFLRRKYWTK